MAGGLSMDFSQTRLLRAWKGLIAESCPRQVLNLGLSVNFSRAGPVVFESLVPSTVPGT